MRRGQKHTCHDMIATAVTTRFNRSVYSGNGYFAYSKLIKLNILVGSRSKLPLSIFQCIHSLSGLCECIEGHFVVSSIMD